MPDIAPLLGKRVVYIASGETGIVDNYRPHAEDATINVYTFICDSGEHSGLSMWALPEKLRLA
jgi:hypothetical protein